LAGDLIRRRVGEAETRLQAEADTRVREALSVGLTRADQQLMEQGFRRLTQDSKYAARDLTPLAQDRMLALAYWLWESNPLAQWLVEVVVDFVWGEGGNVTATDPKVREVVQGFWQDPVNQLELRMDTFVRELGLQGELCLPVFVNDVDGHVRLGYVDPAEIDEIQTDPNNILVPWTVVLKATAAGTRRRYLKVVRLDERRGSPGFGSLMPALPNETDLISGRLYDGSCLLFQVNKVSNARRGRSDLLALIDWLDGYDDMLFSQMERAQLLDSFFWDAEVQGATEEELQGFLQKNAKIRRGMVRAHNEKVKWSAIAPDLKAADKDTLARMLRGHLLGSRSLPEHYYGLGGDVNLATAKEMGLPTQKRMTRRQKVVRFMLQDVARFAVHQAIRHGRLAKDVDQTLAVTLPEISMRDTTAITTALTSLTVALVQAEQQGWIRKETATKLFALVSSQLGLEIKAEEELLPLGEPTREAMRDYDPAKVRQLRDRLERP
jgi:hypothetical protein